MLNCCWRKNAQCCSSHSLRGGGKCFEAREDLRTLCTSGTRTCYTRVNVPQFAFNKQFWVSGSKSPWSTSSSKEDINSTRKPQELDTFTAAPLYRGRNTTSHPARWFMIAATEATGGSTFSVTVDQPLGYKTYTRLCTKFLAQLIIFAANMVKQKQRFHLLSHFLHLER